MENQPTVDPNEFAGKQQQEASSSQERPPQHDTECRPVLALIDNQQELFNLALARRREADRRLKMLGTFAQEDFEKKQLRAFAQGRYVSEKTLTSWKHDYLLHGFDGLLPQDWTYLKAKSQQVVVKRLQALGELTETITISAQNVHDLVEKHGWHHRKAERLVRRYQIDGIWGLAPERDPERLHRPKDPVPPAEFATATPKARAEAERRLALITPYLGKRPIPNEELKTYAEEHGSSLRAIRDYLAKFKKWDVAGLLPKEERADKGHPHTMSTLMEDIIAALRFSQMDIPLHKVHSQARQRALMLGEPEPTLWQVRYICDRIPEEVKLVADKRFGQFRSERRLTYRFQFDGSVIVYQIDFTRVDVLVRDIRRRGYRTLSEETRPYLITCLECSSRLILAKLLTYNVPDSNDIAAVIRDALTVTDEKPYGGIPHAIWVDQGAQLVSQHVQRIARDLHFELKDGKPNHPEDRGDPQERGREERFFGTLNTRLWSTLSGYIHSTTKERNPNVKAELTITDLARELQVFIDKYHHEKHSETQMTPLEFWAQKCQAKGAPPRDLDILLLRAEDRVVQKDHIHYGTRRYWHDDLAEIPVGTKVEVRAQADYMRPDEIEVYSNGHHLCTAFAHDSAKGRAVNGTRVLAAQRRQKQRIKETINKKKTTLHNADRQIEAEAPLIKPKEHSEQDAQEDSTGMQETPGAQEAASGSEPQDQHDALPDGQQPRSSRASSLKKKPAQSSRPGPSKRSPWAIALEAKEHQQNEKTGKE